MEVHLSAVHRQAEQSHSRLEKVYALEDLIQLQSKSASSGRASYQIITTFLLLEFGNIPEIQSLLFLLFTVVTVIGNILIVLVVAAQHLHKPMYFFLWNLSCLETCYSSTILPRMSSSFLTGDKSISIGSCITQFYFFGFLAVTESFLLSVMSYAWYLAVFFYRRLIIVYVLPKTEALRALNEVFSVFYTIV
ncbi:LOW QUALITY PROTEIN: olfactory receptor 11A1-like [Cariama cristata]